MGEGQKSFSSSEGNAVGGCIGAIFLLVFYGAIAYFSWNIITFTFKLSVGILLSYLLYMMAGALIVSVASALLFFLNASFLKTLFMPLIFFYPVFTIWSGAFSASLTLHYINNVEGVEWDWLYYIVGCFWNGAMPLFHYCIDRLSDKKESFPNDYSPMVLLAIFVAYISYIVFCFYPKTAKQVTNLMPLIDYLF